MKFGKTLREQIIHEWRFYAVDYKALKKTLSINSDGSTNVDEFYGVLDESKNKLSKFCFDKEAWANDYMQSLEERVQSLRETCLESPCHRAGVVASRSDASLSSSCSEVSDSSTESSVSWLKDEYRRVGHSKHFQSFIYAKKSLATFDRELDLLLEFLNLNATAFSKIMKKFDKRTGSNARDEYLAEFVSLHHDTVLSTPKTTLQNDMPREVGRYVQSQVQFLFSSIRLTSFVFFLGIGIMVASALDVGY